MAKRLMSFLLLCCICIGCSKQYTFSYESLSKVIDSQISQETFYVAFIQPGCVDCKAFKQIVVHNAKFDCPLYIVNVDDQDCTREELKQKVNKHFGSLEFTPTIFHVKYGEVLNSMVFEEGMNIENWVAFTRE